MTQLNSTDHTAADRLEARGARAPWTVKVLIGVVSLLVLVTSYGAIYFSFFFENPDPGLGTWAFGGPRQGLHWGVQDDADSIATVYRAVEAGINWLDTAPIYGHGHSEEVVGRALQALPEADRPYVFTKCGMTWDETDHFKPGGRSARPDAPPGAASRT